METEADVGSLAKRVQAVEKRQDDTFGMMTELHGLVLTVRTDLGAIIKWGGIFCSMAGLLAMVFLFGPLQSFDESIRAIATNTADITHLADQVEQVQEAVDEIQQEKNASMNQILNQLQRMNGMAGRVNTDAPDYPTHSP